MLLLSWKRTFARNCPKQNSKDDSQNSSIWSKIKRSAHYAERSSPDSIINEEALFTFDLTNDSNWIIDSGTTQHMTFERNRLSHYVEFEQPCIVILGDNCTILAYGQGTYHIIANLKGSIQHIALHDVLYLPDLEKNLLSVWAMVKLGTSVEFDSDQCKITQNSKLLAIDEMQGKLYILKIIPDEQVNIAREDSSVQLWYCHFCHLGIDNVTKLIKGKMVEGMNCITNDERN